MGASYHHVCRGTIFFTPRALISKLVCISSRWVWALQRAKLPCSINALPVHKPKINVQGLLQKTFCNSRKSPIQKLIKVQFLKRDLPTVNTYHLSVLQIWCQGLDTGTLELITETHILNWLLLKSEIYTSIQLLYLICHCTLFFFFFYLLGTLLK